MHTKNKLNLNSGEDQRQKKIISKGFFLLNFVRMIAIDKFENILSFTIAVSKRIFIILAIKAIKCFF